MSKFFCRFLRSIILREISCFRFDELKLSCVSDFVQNLIEKQQYIEAVRFICAYKLADKIDPVGLLRLEIASANQIRGKIGGKKPIEIKVRRKDTSIRILRNVLQCISDNNLESQDLVDKVRNHIIGLEWKKENLIVRAKQKEELGHLVSKLSSALEVHQTEEKKCANNEFSENQVQQPEETISADIAVTEDQVKVQQPEETISADITDTEDQVKVQQPKEKEIEKGAVTKNQVNVQQAEAKKPINGVLQAQQPAIALYTKQAKKLKKQAKKLKTMQSANGAVTVNQVKVQQPEAKKPGNGAVSMNQVKMQQPEAQKPANRAVTMNQVQGQQPEENISTNETVTTNQVQVQQPQEKKRPIEAVPNDHQLHQSAHNNKRPRTGAPHALPPHVFTPHYQHIFRPSVMPASFGLPPNDYAVTGGPNYFCHPRPYPPPF
ncbi:uncharacterized protein LOC130745091 [Lotus japonicus]|uniref:uncharacterized protein LOC130745091 n=1 Tax=Lotus japonicus TaxID=34305 RepID=UPI00258A98C7|nr:uncharacterized protein LOC130745091 [Lotus japonicus]